MSEKKKQETRFSLDSPIMTVTHEVIYVFSHLSLNNLIDFRQSQFQVKVDLKKK